VRYPQGGGLTAERQAFREQIRMQAAERFAAGENSASVAKALRVHVRSVQRWRAVWKDGGEAALESKGPPNHPQLSEAQFAVLEAELERGSCRARLAGPEKDAEQDQDGDRPPIPQVLHCRWRLLSASPPRLVVPGASPPRRRT
jgi:transposase